MSLPCVVQLTPSSPSSLHDLWGPQGAALPNLWSTCGLYTHLPYGYDYQIQPGIYRVKRPNLSRQQEG